MDANKMKYYSEKNIRSRNLTMSLNKIEALLEKKEMTRRDVDATAAYIYFNKIDKVNKLKHYLLSSEINLFKNAIKNKDPIDPKYKLYLSLEKMGNKSENEQKLKEKYREKIISFLNETNLSLNFLSDKSGVHYSNLYNFVMKGQNKLSFKNIDRVYEVIEKNDV